MAGKVSVINSRGKKAEKMGGIGRMYPWSGRNNEWILGERGLINGVVRRRGGGGGRRQSQEERQGGFTEHE